MQAPLLLFLTASALALGGCATQKPAAYQSPTYQSITPTDFYVGSDGAAVFSSLQDTVSSPSYLGPATKVLVVGYEYRHWAVFVIDGKRYYTRKRYFRAAPKSTLPAYDYSQDARNVKTGPRGGRYYINKNGNKTYIKR